MPSPTPNPGKGVVSPDPLKRSQGVQSGPPQPNLGGLERTPWDVARGSLDPLTPLQPPLGGAEYITEYVFTDNDVGEKRTLE